MPKLVLTLLMVTLEESPDSGTGVESPTLTAPEMKMLLGPAQSVLEEHRRPAVALPDGLTAREVEVLRLIARGKSNQRIADELLISLHTVARHVSNIFCKTGAANRAEAAVYAARHDLL